MKKIFIFITILLISFFTAFSARYVGSKKCKMCHNSAKHGKAYDILYKTKHSNAFKGLVEDGKETDPVCVECHSTGFNEGGYKIGAPETYKFEGVQCEECHGPGSKYTKISIMKNKKLAIKNGLRIPDKKRCLKCHDREKYPWAKEFIYKDRLKKIDHTY
ncbi:MAG: multiheme c-type cytochrome [Acidobacteriota bacterium]